MASLHGRLFKKPSAVLGDLLETKPSVGGHRPKTPSNKANTIVITGRIGPGQAAINGEYWLATSLHNDCPFYVKSTGTYFLYFSSSHNRWYLSPELGSEEFACAFVDGTPASVKEDVLAFSGWTVFDGSGWILDPAVRTIGTEVPYLEPGDCISKQILMDMSGRHEGIYVGGFEVVEVAPSRGDLGKLTSLSDVKDLKLFTSEGCNIISAVKRNSMAPSATMPSKYVSNHGIREGSPYSRAEIVARALSYVGKTWPYDPIHHNCQSFANWCQTDRLESYQGEHIKTFFDHKKSWREVVHKPNTGSETLDHVAYGAKIAGRGVVVAVANAKDFLRNHMSPPRKKHKDEEKK